MRDRSAIMQSARPLELIMEADHMSTPPQRNRSSSWSSWRRNAGLSRSQPRYSLQFQTDENSFLLRLKVIGAYALAKKDIFGASDPYVRVELQTIDGDITIETFLTKTKKRTLNPVWDEEFIFRVKPQEHKLLIQVFDENRLTRDDFLGMVELPLSTVLTETAAGLRPVPLQYPLKPRRSVARSRVRGNIEVYHALVGREGAEATEGAPPDEWELVEPPPQVGDVQPVEDEAETLASFTGGGDWEVVDHTHVALGGDPLPTGWEERQDANGRTYYVNHVARSTQWERPTLTRNLSTESHTERMENAVTEFQRRFHISNDSSERADPAQPTDSADHQDEVTNNEESNSDSTPYTTPIRSPEPETDSEALPDTPEHTLTENPKISVQNVNVPEELLQSTDEPDNSSAEPSNGFDEPGPSSALPSYGFDEPGPSSAQPSNGFDEPGPSSAQPEPNAAEPEQPEPTSLSNGTNCDSNLSTEDDDVVCANERDRQTENETENAQANCDNPTEDASDIETPNEEMNVNVTDQSEANEPVNDEDGGNNELLTFDENHFSTPTAVTPQQRRRHMTTESSIDSEDESDAPSTDSTRSSSANSGHSQNLPSSEGLPAGWSMQKAPNGRVFYIDHNAKTTTWIDPRTGCASSLPSAAAATAAAADVDALGPLPEGWEERVHTDGRIFFIDHNTRSTQWEDPRLSNPQIAGPAVPYSRDYKRKYEYLKSNLRKPSNVPNKLEIKVRRSSILEDSYRIISSVSRLDLLKTKLWVEFEAEVGLDYGGLAREWFFLLSKEMFNPYYGLFEYSAMDNYTLQINPNSGVCNEEHLNYFKFIGRVAGMAMYHGKLLDAFFIRPFYKMMLGKQIELQDMESVDLEYYNSLMWIKENDPSDLYLTFAVDEEQFGKTQQRELKPGGANISVDNDNKDEYIKLVIEWRFVRRVQEQMFAFLEGVGALVPLHMLKIFDEHELELLLCGIQHVDVRDWRAHCLYKHDYHANHRVVQWFWRVVLSFSNEMRSRLLQFVTGTSRVPMNGFKELYGSNGPQLFTIEKWGTPDNYPRAHTCFNRLDLPPYESYQQLREKLIVAIEGSQGFAGVD